MKFNSDKNQEIKRKFVKREVIHCASALVYELAQKADCFPDYYDDLLDAYRGLPDYQEAAEENGWKKTDNCFVHEEYAPYVYEHWIVSDCLVEKLEEKGERVLRDFFGMTIWCRTTTGQEIMLDHVISEICSDMEILEG